MSARPTPARSSPARAGLAAASKPAAIVRAAMRRVVTLAPRSDRTQTGLPLAGCGVRSLLDRTQTGLPRLAPATHRNGFGCGRATTALHADLGAYGAANRATGRGGQGRRPGAEGRT